MNILIAGAGSVGQVYGYSLHKGGANITFYVRPKYLEDMAKGLILYDLSRGKNRYSPIEFTDFDVISSAAEAGQKKWDYVLLCIPSTGLKGEWLPALVKEIGDAPVVGFTPGPNDRDYILQFMPDTQLMMGMITLISYPAPLPGETLPKPGTAYWFPPLAAAPIEGPSPQTEELVRTFKAGGQPTKKDKGLAQKVIFPNAMLNTFIGGLERAGWSFDTIKQRDHLNLVCDAIQESLAVAAAMKSSPAPLPFKFVTPSTIRMILAFGTRIMPFDLEVYLRVHFTKVGAQTRQNLQTFANGAQTYDLPAKNLNSIIDAIGVRNDESV